MTEVDPGADSIVRNIQVKPNPIWTVQEIRSMVLCSTQGITGAPPEGLDRNLWCDQAVLPPCGQF